MTGPRQRATVGRFFESSMEVQAHVPHHKQFKKSLRKESKRRTENRAKRSRLRMALRNFRALSDPQAAETALPKVVSLLDKGAKTRLIHPRSASRLKSRLATRLERLRAASA